MRELLKLIKDKIAEEVKKENLNTGLIIELVEMYRRFLPFESETVAEVLPTPYGRGGRITIPPFGGQAVRTDSYLDEMMASFKGVKNLTAPQEMAAILDARRHFESTGDSEMVQRIDKKLKKKVLDLLGEEPLQAPQLVPHLEE